MLQMAIINAGQYLIKTGVYRETWLGRYVLAMNAASG